MPAARLGWLTARVLPPPLIVLLTFAAFLPTLQNGFVNWDDGENFLENPHYRGLGWAQLRWMFTTSLMGHYVPLTWLTLGMDYLLWGMHPRGYHLTSLLLHAATALVFYFVTRRLLRLARPCGPEAPTRYAAGFAALLFALHPLRVESVAWVTERRDVLSGLFFLLAILAYLRATEGAGRARRGWLAASVMAFALALLSKAIVMTLPLVLLALDAYPLRRLTPPARGVWRGKLPFFLLALAGALTALVALHPTAPLQPLAEHGVAARLAQAGFGLAFYLWKSLVPVGLSPLYPLVLPLNPLAPPFVLSGVVVLLITGGALLAWHRFPAWLVVWVCYAAILSPVLGITHYGAQITADRYSYLACLGWAVLAGAGLLAAWRAWEGGRIGRPLITLTLSLALLTVGGLGALTWRQVGVWHDSIRLWSHALKVVPDSYVAHYNLGNALLRERRLSEAIEHYRRSLEIEPVQAEAHNNLGNALLSQGKLTEAIDHFQHALRIDPRLAEAYYNLGNAFAALGQLPKAIDHYRHALRIKPFKAATHYNLGNALVRQGEYAEATHHFRQALQARLTPAEMADVYNNLGGVLVRQGKLTEAEAAYQQALRFQPALLIAHNNLGTTLAAQGKLAEAIAAYQQALRLKPDDASARFNLARAYLQLNQREAALREYRILEGIDRELADRLLSQINR